MGGGAHRFEGDLNEKGLKRTNVQTFSFPRFEGDLNEKGLKPPAPRQILEARGF